MIHANRTQPLQAFVDFVRSRHPKDWNNDFVEADHELYKECRDELLRTQDGVSAYTEVPLADSAGVHIDHFRKRSLFPHLSFDWVNFMVDERDNPQYGADFKDNKVKTDDYEKIVNPADPNPERFFSYMGNGEMVPADGLSHADEAKAKFTIQIFNLNHPSLKSRRLAAMNMVRDYGRLPKATIKSCMKGSGFPTAVDYAMDNMLP